MSDAALRRDQRAWLLASATLSLAPHTLHLPRTLSLLCALLLGWHAFLAWQGRRLPPRLLLLPLAGGLLALVLQEYGKLLGKEPGVALLAGLLSLKLLEGGRARDGQAVVLLSFFMQLAQFLYAQSMLVAALALLGTLAAIASLLALEGPPATFRTRLSTAGLLTLQGVPLMVVLFVLFPRVEGPLWSLPADAAQARSGLSDSMRPGDVAQLSESGEIAFRAAFTGPPPPPSERYWRGPVLTRFDGHTWRQARSHSSDTPAYRPQGPAYPYILTLEPHNQRWLLALDFPAAAPGLLYNEDLQLLTREPVRTRLRLALQSHPTTPVGLDAGPAELQQALVLPPDSNPRTLALGHALRALARRTAEIPDLALADFRQRGLRYTLDPAPLGEDDVDGFLFDTRQGFCEHFAAAFVVTLRAAGIPARVVTGYQGGELNPVDGTLVIRQSDAHAWTEVWLAGRGWLRIDPTAASAPLRIESGLAAALPDSPRLALLTRLDLAWLKRLRNQLEALDNRWNQWVLGYNPPRQKALLSDLGLRDTNLPTLTALMIAACCVVMGLLTFWALRRRVAEDALDRRWRRFCRRLAALGLPRADWEGPLDYAERIAASRAELAEPVRRIAADYARLRYGPPAADPVLRRRFHHSIKKFRPR